VQCVPTADCSKLVKAGHGDMFWILQALQGFQTKLNYATSFMSLEGFEASVQISAIAKDFSAPETYNTLDMLSGLIGKKAQYEISRCI